MPGPNPSTMPTRFLVISDTHNFELENDTAVSVPLHLPLPKVDVVLHCGDLTHCGGSSSYKKALKMLGAFDAELKLVIAGNHDLDLDKQYWDTHLDEGDEPEDHLRAVDTMKGPLAAEAGVEYLDEGTYTFNLKTGATFTIYASPYCPAYCDWAFAYEYDQDRFNEAHQVADGVRSIAKHPIPSNVDISMTHGPPQGILDECSQGNAGCENLFQALRRARPRMHCFGHIHEGNGARIVDWESQESRLCHDGSSQNQGNFGNTYPEPLHAPIYHGRQSLMVNAAVMDEKNQPVYKPWIVDLELPRTVSSTTE